MFVEEPAGGEWSVFVPVNSTTTFRCSAAVGYEISWRFQPSFAAEPVVISESTMGQATLMATSNVSTLAINNITEKLNDSRVICVASQVADMFMNERSEVIVIVYGMYMQYSRLATMIMLHDT